MAFEQAVLGFCSQFGQYPKKEWLYSHGVIMSPQQISISELANRCAQELYNFLNGRPSNSDYGYELFRRALEQHDESAWIAVLHVYGDMVTKWVRRHPKFPIVEEEDTYFTNRAFERLWRNVALKPDKFSRFPNLSKLLKFLKMCVNAAIIDDGLKIPPSGVVIEPLSDHDHHTLPNFHVEVNLAEQINTSHFWRLIDSKLQNELERKVIYAFFLNGMKPREIYAKYPESFNSAKQVSNIKSNVLRRLARIPSFKEVLRDFIDNGQVF